MLDTGQVIHLFDPYNLMRVDTFTFPLYCEYPSLLVPGKEIQRCQVTCPRSHSKAGI